MPGIRTTNQGTERRVRRDPIPQELARLLEPFDSEANAQLAGSDAQGHQLMSPPVTETSLWRDPRHAGLVGTTIVAVAALIVVGVSLATSTWASSNSATAPARTLDAEEGHERALQDKGWLLASTVSPTQVVLIVQAPLDQPWVRQVSLDLHAPGRKYVLAVPIVGGIGRRMLAVGDGTDYPDDVPHLRTGEAFSFRFVGSADFIEAATISDRVNEDENAEEDRVLPTTLPTSGPTPQQTPDRSSPVEERENAG